MKALKKHILKINAKFMRDGRANYIKHKKHLDRYYTFTDATTTQLRKLDIPTIKATYGIDWNKYGQYFQPHTGNLVRKKDLQKIEAYFEVKNINKYVSYEPKIYTYY